MIARELTPPTAITADHELADFDSGEASLDDWLRRRALKNHAAGASRCFVLCSGKRVIGYYSPSAGAISHEASPKGMRRNMQDLCSCCCSAALPLIGDITIKAWAADYCEMPCCGRFTSRGIPACSPSWSTRFMNKVDGFTFHGASCSRPCSR